MHGDTYVIKSNLFTLGIRWFEVKEYLKLNACLFFFFIFSLAGTISITINLFLLSSDWGYDDFVKVYLMTQTTVLFSYI